MSITLSALQKQRRDSAANWTAENPTLLAGEIGIESDTGKIKIGNGSTAWISLGYQGIIPSSGAYPLNQLLMPSGTVSAPSISFDGDTNLGIYRSGTDQLSFTTAGTERLRITSAGLVGVGASSPSERLHVNGGNLLIQDFTPEILLRSPDGTSNRYFISANISDTGDGGIVIGEGANLDTGIQRLVINGSGNVGVGIASPGYPLTVKTTTDGGQAILDLDNQDAGNYGGLRVHLGKTDRECRLEATYSSSFFSFYTDSAERMRLTSTGLGIGSNTPGRRLVVAGDTNTVCAVQGSNIGTSSVFLGDTDDESIGAFTYNHASNHLEIKVNGSERARIDSSGRLLVGTSSDSGGALLQVNGDRIRVGTAKTPASATATGTAGEICWDASYVYVCTATNTWKRSALSTW